MSSTVTVYVGVTRDPQGFHAEGESWFGIHLAYDGAEPAGVMSNEWKFAVYEREDGDNKPLKLVKDAHVETVTYRWSAGEKECAAHALADWVDRRVSDRSTPSTNIPKVENDNGLPSAVGSLHLQHSAAAWDAPVPQWTGLTLLAEVDKPLSEGPNPYYLVPYTEDPPAAEIASKGKSPDEPVTVSIGSFIDASLTSVPATTESQHFPSFLDLPLNPSTSRRFYDAVEMQASALVNAHGVYLDWLASPNLEVPSDDIDDVHKVGLSLALDPIRIALLSSTILASDHTQEHPTLASRDGYILSELFRLVEEKQPEAIDEAIDLEAMRRAVQVRISTSLSDSDTIAAVLGVIPLPNGPSIADVITTQRDFAQRLVSEDGIEMVVVRVMKDVAKDSAIKDAIEKFIPLLQAGFNGAEAVRHEVGYVIQELMMSRGHGEPLPLAKLENEAYYVRRLNPTKGIGDEQILQPLHDVLPDVGFPGIVPDLSDAWKVVVRRLVSEDGDADRFQPDPAPAPLPIRIATSPQADRDGEDIDDYTQDFNGVGVLMQRLDGDQNRWAHANLVGLRVPRAAADFPVAVQPFLPIAVDGRRQLDIDYRGYPLGSPAFSDTHVLGANGAPQAAGLDGGERFYTVADVDYESQAARPYAKPPALAYGKTYRWAAFHVTKAGSLPLPLQADDGPPWQPRADISGADFEKNHAGEETYRRRTAIGAATFAMQEGQPARIGKRYPDVEPLAIEQPRHPVTALASVDLLRRTDGRGELPPGSTVRFEDVRVYGAESKNAWLIVEVHVAADAEWDAQPTAMSQCRGGEHLDVVIPKAIEGAWLRLRLGGDSRASVTCPSPFVTVEKGGVVSQGILRHEPAVLLVAPSKSTSDRGQWLAEVSQEALVECVLPSVSYLDWEHWMNNPTLPAYGIDRSPSDDPFTHARESMLLASMIGGLDDSGAIGKLVQQLPDPAVIGYVIELAAVNDVEGDIANAKFSPCVCGFASVNPFASPGPRDSDAVSSTKNLLETVWTAHRLTFRVTHNAALAISPVAEQSFEVSVPAGVVARIAVRPVVDVTQVANESKEDGEQAIHAGLRQWAIGKTTLVGVDVLVLGGTELLIESVASIPEQAKESTTPAVIPYEGLLDGVELLPGGASRRYDLALNDRFSNAAWNRLFSHIDIDTQRWRFSGRPIYEWYRPKQDADSVSSVVWVGKPVSDVLDAQPAQVQNAAADNHDGDDDARRYTAFESELFFDREDVDCDSRRTRIGIGGELLQTIHWENPAATWFRHGFTFVSRYRGLLRAGPAAGRLGPPRDAHWTRRAAVLADAARLTLTRPQVRCHVPLSTAPDTSAEPGATPPLACILEEHPFAVGGLADRFLAEVALAPGYAFLDQAPGALGPLDLGREIGRDPRLESWSWMPHRDPASPNAPLADHPDHTARLMLRVEGPVGLHFEHATAPAPAWPNCQYLLQPVSLDERVFVPDESFIGVRVRRALDPAWVAGNANADSSMTIPRPGCWWIEWDGTPPTVDTALLTLGSYAVCVYSEGGELRIDRELIDRASNAGHLVLCEIPRTRQPLFDRLVLLHSGAGDGRHVLSLLGIPKDAAVDVENGRSNAPVILATIPWSVPDGAGGELRLGGEPEYWPLLASEPTFLEWARTARDAGTLHALDQIPAGGGELAPPATTAPRGIHDVTRPFEMARTTRPLAAVDLRATVTKDDAGGVLTFMEHRSDGPTPRWLVSSTATSLQPLGIQRHLVALLTAQSSEPGRRFERFIGAARLFGNKPTIEKCPEDFTAVRIAECELPAVVAGTTTESTRIPLSLPDDGVRNKTYRLHVRFANSAESMATVQGLTVTLAWASSEHPRMSCLLKCPAKDGAGEDFTHVRSLDIVFAINNNGEPSGNAFARWASASTVTRCDRAESNAAWSPEATILSGSHLTVKLSSTSACEVWADVSVIHSAGTSDASTPDFDAFDVDWLFTPAEPDDLNPAHRIDPVTLARLADAQLRVLSISPPIKVRPPSGIL